MKVKKKINMGIFISDLGKKQLIFSLGIGAEIRPQNRPRKIPASYSPCKEKKISLLGKKSKQLIVYFTVNQREIEEISQPFFAAFLSVSWVFENDHQILGIGSTDSSVGKASDS